MTRQEAHPQKPARNHSAHHSGHHAGKHPWRTRLIMGVVVLACGIAAGVTLFDRKDLPPAVRDNPYVAKVYRERDVAIEATSSLLDKRGGAEEPVDANADMKQQGYPKTDRAKLDTIISKGKPAE
ncbi:MAG: hypothetical protein ACAH83_04935 [Alphaproteobacteria bacterium]